MRGEYYIGLGCIMLSFSIHSGKVMLIGGIVSICFGLLIMWGDRKK